MRQALPWIACPLFWPFNVVRSSVARHSFPMEEVLLFVEEKEYYDKERLLNIGDFQELNNLVQNAIVSLPDATLSRGYLSLDITSVSCTNFQVGDMIVSSRKTSLTTISVDVEIQQLDMNCMAHYHYSAWPLHGSGDVTIDSAGNGATTTTLVTSTDYNEYPPTSLQIQSCNPTVQIQNINFQGGIASMFLEAVQGMLHDSIEQQAQQRICVELQAYLQRAQNFLQASNQLLDRYNTSKLNWDPIQAEKSLLVNLPPNVNLLNLQDKQTAFGQWVEMALQQTVTYLNTPVQIANGQQDLQANILLREYMLDSNRAYTINISDFPVNPILYQGQDRLTNTTIRINTIQLFGLDTLTRLDPLDSSVGNFTLSNKVAWNYLNFDLDVTIEMGPSTLPDSYIQNSGSTGVLENVHIRFGTDQLEASIAVLLAIQQNLLEKIRFGSILTKAKIFDRLLSTVFELNISTLSIGAIDIQPPTLDGFVSPGLDRVITEAVETAFLMYERVMLNASPAFFQMYVRGLLNSNIQNMMARGFTCTFPQNTSNGSVDLRDLILPPNASLIAGGSGLEPYGNIISSVVMPTLEAQMLTASDLNSRFIRPLTKNQSGEEGFLAFSSVLINYVSPSAGENSTKPPLWDRLQFQVSNLRIRNLDTVIDPIVLFEPTAWNELFNMIELGSANSTRPLNLTVRILVDVGGADSPLAMRNEVDFRLSVPSSSLAFDIVATIRESALMNFPLNDFSNVYCWLAALGPPGFGSNSSVATQRRETEVLGLTNFSVIMSSFLLDASCVSCTSPGGESLRGLLQALGSAGLYSSLMANRLGNLCQELFSGISNSLDVMKLIEEAPQLCPYSPAYLPGARPISNRH